MPRIVYSLLFETHREPGGDIVQLIAPLDHLGQSRYIRPLGKARVVDLRPGDWVLHRPTRRKFLLTEISAYRQHHISEEALKENKVYDGFLVPTEREKHGRPAEDRSGH